MAKDRGPRRSTSEEPPAPERSISPGRQKFVSIWSKVWGLMAAVLVVFIAARLPASLQAGDTAQLMRDLGIGLICFNLIMQAMRPTWPLTYALPLTFGGIALWLAGWLA